jgi:ubiquinone/menaquinone biosynthesis C-methylase UbiE
MSVFSWTAPLFKLAARRWSDDDFRVVAAMLRPSISGEKPLLDLGGGTGELGAGVAAHLGIQAVIADATPQMLARAVSAPHVTVEHAVAEALPFQDDSFDAVICSDAFHHFRDQEAAVREMARVVRPGGGVIVMDLEPVGWVRPARFVERLLGEPGVFLSPEQMVVLMARNGISGSGSRHRASSYVFLGTVDKP